MSYELSKILIVIRIKIKSEIGIRLKSFWIRHNVYGVLVCQPHPPSCLLLG